MSEEISIIYKYFRNVIPFHYRSAKFHDMLKTFLKDKSNILWALKANKHLSARSVFTAHKITAFMKNIYLFSFILTPTPTDLSKPRALKPQLMK